MAGIDKIYGSTEQFDEFWAWANTNKPSITRYFYPRDGYTQDRDRPITNFPTLVDVWLWDNCPITWVKEALLDQYNGPPALEPKSRRAYYPGNTPRPQPRATRPWNVSRRQWGKL